MLLSAAFPAPGPDESDIDRRETMAGDAVAGVVKMGRGLGLVMKRRMANGDVETWPRDRRRNERRGLAAARPRL